jgi:enoyl-CoA hydratase/carnithine racemase
MLGQLVEYRVELGLGIIELNHPPANTYSYEMMREFDEAILTARMDEAVHVLIVRGEGEKFFSAGADIKMLAGANPRRNYFACMPMKRCCA